MKSINITTLLVLILLETNIAANAQDKYTPIVYINEKYGHTVNLGVGLGYYGYVGHSIAAFHADYEIAAAPSVTLAPFINYYSFQDYNYWGDLNNKYKNYYYRETVIPIGVKGTYYLDKFLNVNKNWDIYVAASLGFVVRSTTWEDGYNGQTKVSDGGTGPFYVDIHVGLEYHLTHKTGIFLDLSTGVSTIGLGFHI